MKKCWTLIIHIDSYWEVRCHVDEWERMREWEEIGENWRIKKISPCTSIWQEKAFIVWSSSFDSFAAETAGQEDERCIMSHAIQRVCQSIVSIVAKAVNIPLQPEPNLWALARQVRGLEKDRAQGKSDLSTAAAVCWNDRDIFWSGLAGVFFFWVGKVFLCSLFAERKILSMLISLDTMEWKVDSICHYVQERYRLSRLVVSHVLHITLQGCALPIRCQ